jgi:crossover junction endodeoxyribonuclease RuvC
MTVIGLDSGLATCGIAVVRLLPAGEELVAVEVFTSKPSDRKVGVRAADDTARRARELAVVLGTVLEEHRPVAIAIEAPSWPRNAGSAAKMGIAFGVAFGLAEEHDLPLVMATPMDVKVGVVGRKSASKDEVVLAVETRFPGITWPKQTGLWEHVADAVGVVLACLDSEPLRMARRLAANGQTPPPTPETSP